MDGWMKERRATMTGVRRRHSVDVFTSAKMNNDAYFLPVSRWLVQFLLLMLAGPFEVMYPV